MLTGGKPASRRLFASVRSIAWVRRIPSRLSSNSHARMRDTGNPAAAIKTTYLFHVPNSNVPNTTSLTSTTTQAAARYTSPTFETLRALSSSHSERPPDSLEGEGGAGAGPGSGVRKTAPAWDAARASPNSRVVAKRSAGRRASARRITSSRPSGTVDRMVRSEWGDSVMRRAMVTCGVLPDIGGSPPSIS